MKCSRFFSVSLSGEQAQRRIPSAPSPQSEVYKKHEKRGMAVIFSHKEYDINLPPRYGTDKDRDDLYAILRHLKFDVSAYDDLCSAEITDILSRRE